MKCMTKDILGSTQWVGLKASWGGFGHYTMIKLESATIRMLMLRLLTSKYILSCNFQLKSYWFRGGLIIKKRENFGHFQKKSKMSKIKIRTFKTYGGVSNFQKCQNYKLLSDPILKKEILKHLIWPFSM